jgi:transposase
LIRAHVFAAERIHADDTTVPVLAKGKTRTGRLWTYVRDDRPFAGPGPPAAVFFYSRDRGGEHSEQHLVTFAGLMQADAYAGFNRLYEAGRKPGPIIEAACWAHARRKFFDAKDTDARRCGEMLEMVRQLYAVEDEADKKIALLGGATQQQKDDIRRDLRQRQSVPVLEKIKTWLGTEIKLVLPRSPMAEAINYTLNQWQALCVYADHGFLNIDNNAAERALKLIALGRKNWLFAGNDAFGGHYATLYSLIASAQRHGLNPQAYLTSVLSQIATTPMSQLEQFLPDNWKAQAEAERLSAQAGAPPAPS